MTQDYSESLAKGAVSRLNGLGKLLTPGDEITIKITADGDCAIWAASPTMTNAQMVYCYEAKDGKLLFRGRVTQNAFGCEQVSAYAAY